MAKKLKKYHFCLQSRVLVYETCLVLFLTFVFVTGLRVAGLVLNPLSLAVLPSILRHGVSALPVGELHPASTCSGALLPQSPRAPATIHNHLRSNTARSE